MNHVLQHLYDTKALEISPEMQTGLDYEMFQRLLIVARSVASSRPANLVKFCNGKEAPEVLGKSLTILPQSELYHCSHPCLLALFSLQSLLQKVAILLHA